MRASILSLALLSSSMTMAATPVDGWYSSVFGGYTYLPDNISVNNGLFFNNSSYNGGYNAGGRLGYQSNPLRYELEYTYLKADAKYFNVNYLKHLALDSSAIGNLFMANVYYDFPDMLPAIAPFLGVGIGYSYLELHLNGQLPSEVHFKAHDSVFSYQGTLGITYNFSENYAVNLGYRYVATDKTDFGRIFQAHIANAGVIYHFDYGNYK